MDEILLAENEELLAKIVQHGNADNKAWEVAATRTTSMIPNIQLENKIVGTGYVGAAEQGHSVSLSSDGGTLVVSGYIKFINDLSDLDFKIATFLFGSAKQGSALSLSSNGNIVAIGALGDDNQIGAVWLFGNIIEAILYKESTPGTLNTTTLLALTNNNNITSEELTVLAALDTIKNNQSVVQKILLKSNFNSNIIQNLMVNQTILSAAINACSTNLTTTQLQQITEKIVNVGQNFTSSLSIIKTTLSTMNNDSLINLTGRVLSSAEVLKPQVDANIGNSAKVLAIAGRALTPLYSTSEVATERTKIIATIVKALPSSQRAQVINAMALHM